MIWKKKEVMFVMWIKKEDELHVLMRKACFELVGVSMNGLCLTEN